MNEETIRKAIRGMVADMVPVQTVLCTVVSVDDVKQTCVVKSVKSELNFNNVLLSVAQGDGFVNYPVVGSKVLIGLIENLPAAAFVVMFSEVDKIMMRGGTHGGLAIVGNVADEINELREELNDLKQILALTWVPVPNDGGAALKAAAASWAGLVLPQIMPADIENNKITHG